MEIYPLTPYATIPILGHNALYPGPTQIPKVVKIFYRTIAALYVFYFAFLYAKPTLRHIFIQNRMPLNPLTEREASSHEERSIQNHIEKALKISGVYSNPMSFPDLLEQLNISVVDGPSNFDNLEFFITLANKTRAKINLIAVQSNSQKSGNELLITSVSRTSIPHSSTEVSSCTISIISTKRLDQTVDYRYLIT